MKAIPQGARTIRETRDSRAPSTDRLGSLAPVRMQMLGSAGPRALFRVFG